MSHKNNYCLPSFFTLAISISSFCYAASDSDLIDAAKNFNFDSIRVALDKGANPNSTDQNSDSVLQILLKHLANCSESGAEVINRMLEEDPELFFIALSLTRTVEDKEVENFLFRHEKTDSSVAQVKERRKKAIQNYEFRKSVKKLIYTRYQIEIDERSVCFDVNKTQEIINAVRLLIESGADVNYQNSEGETPLNTAVDSLIFGTDQQYFRNQLLDLLLYAGADITLSQEPDMLIQNLRRWLGLGTLAVRLAAQAGIIL